MWDFYRKKNHENVWVASVKNGKNIDRDSENQHGNVCIITQDTKLVRINDAEEGWAYSKGSKCIQKKNLSTLQKTLDLSQPATHPAADTDADVAPWSETCLAEISSLLTVCCRSPRLFRDQLAANNKDRLSAAICSFPQRGLWVKWVPL